MPLDASCNPKHHSHPCRFLLRRAAVRALSQQATAVSRTYSPLSSRVTSFSPSTSKSIALRGFHQSRIWRAEEEQKGDIAKEGGASPAESENAAETVTAEPSAQEQQTEMREESIATPEVADAASKETTAEAVADKAREVAAETTQGFSEAAQSGADAVSAATTRPGRPQHNNLSSHRNPRPSRILYIGNLFFEVRADQLEAEFKKFGQVANSRIVTDSRGLSKGFGYVEMTTQEAADAALRELDQRVFEGRRMAVQYHVPRDPARQPRDQGGREGRTRNPPSKTLFIGNMSYQMSDKDLNGKPVLGHALQPHANANVRYAADLFREIRDVLDVRVAIDRRSGQPRGFAHADFIDTAAAERAKEHLEKKVVYGRPLKVDFSASAQKASPSDE